MMLNEPLGSITSIASNLPLENSDVREGIVLRFWLKEVASWAVPEERVNDCLKHIIPTKNEVEIHRVAGGKRAIYKNLGVCGSVWMCPICSSRITEHRRKELNLAISRWDGSMLMITYTLSHSREMLLTDVLNSLKEAYRGLKSGAFFKAIKRDYYWFGSVRALEVTYGKNGWHTHIHELVFVEKHGRTPEENCLTDVQIEGLKHRMFKQWRVTLKRENKTADFEHGLDIRTGKSYVADYVAKWGREPITDRWDVAHEITKQPQKKTSFEGNRTPLQILFDFGEGDKKSGKIWREYALGFKGSHQLQWSRDLREVCKLAVEQSDLEIASEIPPEFSLFATLTADEWKQVRNSHNEGRLLKAAAELDADGFRQFLNGIIENYG